MKISFSQQCRAGSRTLFSAGTSVYVDISDKFIELENGDVLWVGTHGVGEDDAIIRFWFKIICEKRRFRCDPQNLLAWIGDSRHKEADRLVSRAEMIHRIISFLPNAALADAYFSSGVICPANVFRWIERIQLSRERALVRKKITLAARKTDGLHGFEQSQSTDRSKFLIVQKKIPHD